MPELVSCLCISRPSRWGQLQRAILDFNAQTRIDRELVIVVDNRNDFHSLVQGFVSGLTLNAPVIVLPRTINSVVDGLGFAAAVASGTILTLWDDDNLNHPDRLNNQVAVQTRNAKAITVYESGFYYFHEHAELFPVSCFRPETAAAIRVLPTTIMAFRRYFPVLDHTVRARTSEQMITVAAKANQAIKIITQPFMHMIGVTYDGKVSNHLRTYATHREIAETTVKDVAWIEQHKTEMVEALDSYSWDVPSIVVAGSDGNAFTYKPKKLFFSPDLYPVTLADPVTASVPK